ncbi:MAG: archaemetzincin family Zn-dependent metalloprotease [Candidatus Hadarchaeales archaeon]
MRRLVLLPLGNAEATLTKKISDKAQKILSLFIEKCEVGPRAKIPLLTYDPSRRQFNAELILDLLIPKVEEENLALFITDIDLFAPGLNFIFGLAQCPGRVGIVSIARLNPAFYEQRPNAALFLKRAVKEVVHETGHLLGLGHCKNEKCVMRFSNTIFEVDEKASSFCSTCTRKLKQFTQPSQF